MKADSPRWHQITPSEFAWEQEALDYVREQLPDHDPCQAWANFEFIADNGAVYEVDLLVLTGKGFYLVEIKSRPGRLDGDAHTWVWHHDGRRKTYDNPYILANRKAKYLKSLLDRQAAVKSAKGRLPFLAAKVFLSAPDLRVDLPSEARQGVFGREQKDLAAPEDQGKRRPDPLPGLKSELLDIPAEDYKRRGKRVDRPIARAVARALEEAGVRPSNRQRRVGDYELGDLITDGPGYQDFAAKHVDISHHTRRVRIYSVAPDTDPAIKRTVEAAAEREFRILDSLRHANILPVHDYRVSELGPALTFDHEPKSMRLDQYLDGRAGDLGVDERVEILRQIAEAMRYAHSRHVVHRALTPAAIEVVDPDASTPEVRVLNWQTGAREAAESATTAGPAVSATVHPDRLVDQLQAAFMAPETFAGLESAEQLDVFSLGAIAYLVFAGSPPARSLSGLVDALKKSPRRGLDIAAVLDGAETALCDLISHATDPAVETRTASVDEFLDHLTQLEDALTAPEEQAVDPRHATKGDALAGGFTITERLGQGGSAVAFEVEHDGEQRVLKVALDPDKNDRILQEAEVLQALRHQTIVDTFGITMVGDRAAVVLERAGERTLADRLREEGALQLDLLQRLGDDLLDVVIYLEESGIAHRDIKPANLGVAPRGRHHQLRLALFDFSLSRASREDVRAGTPPYLDPFLPLRTPPRWDEHAERFAAAVTLYEMASGTLPRWGDGKSDPALIDDEVTIEQERFEPSVARSLSAFFRTSLARDPSERFSNGLVMRDAWKGIFTGRPDEAHQAATPAVPLDQATAETAIRVLELTPAAVSALERRSIYTVGELTALPLQDFWIQPGTGTKVKREIHDAVESLRERLPAPTAEPETNDESRSLDAAVTRLVPRETARNQDDVRTLNALLGLNTEQPVSEWPGQLRVAADLGVEATTVSDVMRRARERWRRSPTVAALVQDAKSLIVASECVMTADELADGLLSLRGSLCEGDERRRVGLAAARAVSEVEQGRASSDLVCARTSHGTPIIAVDQLNGASAVDLADYASLLGIIADEIAAADPLLSPSEALEGLRTVGEPAEMIPLSESRKARLAAATSSSAAVSGRLEFYPRGMEAARAVRLAAGALWGAARLDEREVKRRVRARFPDAAELPRRPQLDRLLDDADLPLQWSDEQRAYRVQGAETLGISAASSHARLPTASDGQAHGPDAEKATHFETRLERAVEKGGFLAFTARTDRLRETESELRRMPVKVIDLDESIIGTMRRVADEKGAEWQRVLHADAEGPGGSSWNRLMELVQLSMDQVRQTIVGSSGVVLLTRAGLLARYDQMPLLEELRDELRLGPIGSLTGLWVLADGAEHGNLPTIDGVPVPTVTPNQYAVVPNAWLRNAHRAAATA